MLFRRNEVVEACATERECVCLPASDGENVVKPQYTK